MKQMLIAAILAMLVFVSSARATTSVLLNSYAVDANSDSIYPNLNTYGSSISEIFLQALGTASNQGDTPTWAAAGISIEIPPGYSEVLSTDYAYNTGSGGADALVSTYVDSIEKQSNGHWIASDIDTTQYGYAYNVDMGTGSLEFDLAGSGGGSGGGTLYVSVTY
jgi:hypothetical protein